MKIAVISDCHLDMRRDGGWERIYKVCKAADRAKILVIAGDLCEVDESLNMDNLGLYGKAVHKWSQHFEHIIAVAGNHEYYNTSMGVVDRYMLRLQERFPAFKSLDLCEYLEIEGRRFVGGTLWFKEPDIRGKLLSIRMNDFRMIGDFEPSVYARAEAAKKRIEKYAGKNSIVVTHHAPSMRSARENYLGEPLTPLFYVNDCTEIICRQEPSVWVHGHMHTPVDYVHPASSTRVLSNPLGYPYQTGGRPGKVFEV